MKRSGIYETLSGHPFLLNLLENTRPVILGDGQEFVGHAAKTGKLRLDKPRARSPHERYHINVFQKATAVTGTTERIEACRVFLTRFPSPRTYGKLNIGHHTWIEYHFGYYIVLFVSLYDIALILTNEVFRLGNQERNCKPDVILSNDYVRYTSTKASLDSLDSLVKPYRDVRNLHIHRGSGPDIPALLKSNDLDFFIMASNLSLMSQTDVSSEIIDLMFKGHSSKIVSHIDDDLNKLDKVLSSFFDSLHPVYTGQTKYLEATHK